MKVSELARRAGIATSAVRFWEAEGVLPSPARGTNGYRDYSDEDLCRVRVLVALRSLGLDLDDSGRLAELCAIGRCDDMAEALLPRLESRRAAVAAARAELEHLDAELARLEQAVRTGQPQPILCVADVRREEGTCAPSQC